VPGGVLEVLYAGVEEHAGAKSMAHPAIARRATVRLLKNCAESRVRPSSSRGIRVRWATPK
jgi:hypothetical protein